MSLEKPLEKAERDLLTVIVRLHAQRGPINRDVLSVEARGQGLEFGRALSVLRGLGLVEEVQKKPFVLARMLGAKPVAQIRPTTQGLKLIHGKPVPQPPVAEAVQTPDPAPVAEETLPPPPPIVEPTPAIAEPAPPAVQDSAPAAAPVEDPAPVAEAVAAPLPQPAPRPRISPNLYTEDLGGIPDEDVALVDAFRVDPEVMEGLRETLDVIGMTLTYAGEALVADRLSKGAAPGDTLLQIVLFGFAHAFRLDALSHETLDMDGLRQYAVEVLIEMAKLRDAGAIAAIAYEADSRLINELIEDAENRLELCTTLLADPVGGAAPPCMLPEDLRLPGEDIGQPSY